METSPRKVVLVTGSSSGIGKATVELFASKGYKVAVCGSRENKVKDVAESCKNLSPFNDQPLEVVLDFSDPENGAVAVRKTVDHFGRLDVLINNAGFYLTTDPLDEGSYEAYRRIYSVNIDAAVKATLAAMDELQRARGNIVFVSSVAGKMAFENFYGYCSSKAAMTMFAQNLALELAPFVRVNVCSPGPVLTPLFHNLGDEVEKMVHEKLRNTTLDHRLAEPEEVASVIFFLVSDEARFVNGHDMIVDGGLLIKPTDDTLSEGLHSK